jgi:hypothetical protein
MFLASIFRSSFFILEKLKTFPERLRHEAPPADQKTSPRRLACGGWN